jgi:LacI family transcriptional regulator
MTDIKAKRVGVLVELTREFGRDLCRGITDFACSNEGFIPFFITPETLKRKSELRTYDGFIARVMTDEMAVTLAALKKPIVDVYYDKPRPGFAIVKTNHSRIGRLAAEHFLERKFKNFAFCGFAGGRFSNYCSRAFQRALAAKGHRCHDYLPDSKAKYEFDSTVLINEQLNRAPDAKALAKWIAILPKPVAVFCPNDLRAWQLLQVCKECDVDVPHDIAILGLDNDVIVCGFSNPMLSSIDPDTPAIGREAARTLVEMMNDPDFRKKTMIRQVDPNRVIGRASTEVYPIDPPWLSDVLVYMRKRVGDRLTADDVFKHLGLSHTTVNRTFRKVLNTTVQKEIAAARMEEARRLLENTVLNTAQIAKRAGFASSTYFVHTFTKAHGISPISWRKQHRQS